MARGVVTWFREHEGTGAISGDGPPPGRDAWVHSSTIGGSGPRTSEVGEEVDVDDEAAQQDSFDFRALSVRRLTADGTSPGPDGCACSQRRGR